jgi:thioredoxin 1
MKPFLFAILCMFAVATLAQAELPSASTKAISQALASGKPTVIDLGARSCPECRKMAPILEALATEYQVKASILFVDVYEDKSTARKFRTQMIPTQIFFNANGQEVKRHIGAMERDEIIKELKAAGRK